MSRISRSLSVFVALALGLSLLGAFDRCSHSNGIRKTPQTQRMVITALCQKNYPISCPRSLRQKIAGFSFRHSSEI